MKLFPNFSFLYLGITLLLGQLVFSQKPIAVEANSAVTTTIFFPSNIEKVVAPAANFQFSYDVRSNIGLLKGSAGKPSNLLVITENGYIYSFALRYAEEVVDFNFILSTGDAINNTKYNTVKASLDSIPDGKSDPEDFADDDDKPDATVVKSDDKSQNSTVVDTAMSLPDVIDYPLDKPEFISSGQDDLYDADREEYYKIFCTNNYLQKAAIIRRFGQNKRVILRLKNILVDRNEKYFVLQIENNSKKEFKVEGVSFFRKSDVGQLEKIMTPLFTYNLQKIIDPNSINEVVLVFKNLNISNKEKIIVVLADIGFNKMIKLPLSSEIVNLSSN